MNCSHADFRRRSREGGGGLVRLSVVACLLGAFALAGCAGRRSDIQTGSIAARVKPEGAMVDMPPGGPAIIGVVERHYTNSTTQEIVLANRSHAAGQNMLTITMFGPVVQTTGPQKEQANDMLAVTNMGQQMKWALWGIPMSVSNYYAQNKYGSFGFATGHTKTGDTCFYGWQRIRAPEIDNTMISHQGTIAIRLRLCEPNATEDSLLAVMTGFTINSYFLTPGWNPFGDAPGMPPNVGVLGSTVLPPASVITTKVATPAAAAPAPRRVTQVVKPQPQVVGDPAILVPDVVPSQYQDYPSVPLP